MKRSGITITLVVLLLHSAGCSESPTAPAVPAVIVIEDLRQSSALTFELTIGVDPPVAIELRYWTDGEPTLVQRVDAAAISKIPIVRLLPDRDYDFELRPVGVVGEVVGGVFRSGILPEDFSQIVLRPVGRATAPLTMLEVRHTLFKAFVAVDSWGRPVWFHRTEGSSYCWTQRPNHNLIVNDTIGGVEEISPLGESVRSLAEEQSQRVHHEILARPDGSVWFLQTVDRDVDGTTYTGDQITRWVPESGALEVLWCAFDHLSPLDDWGEYSVVEDWLHLNSLRVGASGNVLVSSPFLSQIIAIAPDFSTIVWRLGGPNATIAADATARFAFQHTVHEIEPGHILLFDNRGALADGGSYSRALQVVINGDTRSATGEWSFRPPNDNYASIMSSAYRLPSGNTMVGFGPGDGLLESRGPVEVYETTPDGRVVWRLEIVDLPHMYRATPFESLAGEEILDGD